MTRLVAPILALILALASPALAESFQGRVVVISDGDTLRVLRGREQMRVRLHGIDAPERKQVSRCTILCDNRGFCESGRHV